MRSVSDFELQGVQIKDRIDFLERPVLPGFDFLDDFIGDTGYQSRRDFHLVDLFQMLLNLARRKSAPIQRDDVVVKAGETGLVLLDNLRLEAAVTIARHLYRHGAKCPFERLG